jgi:hypothetical protein
VQKSLLKIIVLATLILIVSLPSTSLGQSSLQLSVQSLQTEPYGCLTRSEKERVANCFDRVILCEHTLGAIKQQDRDESSAIFFTGIGGLLFGLFAASMLHK